MTIKTVMDLYNYNDYIDSINQSPFFFLDLLNESAMNMYDFEREENEGYHSENENNFKNPIINHENSTDCNCNDKTNSNTAPNPKKNSSQKDDIYDCLSVDEIKQNLKVNKCVNDTKKKKNMKPMKKKIIIQKRKEVEKPMKMTLIGMINIVLIILLKKANLNLLKNTLNL